MDRDICFSTFLVLTGATCLVATAGKPSFAQQQASVVVDAAAQPELIPAQTTEFVPLEPVVPAATPEELAAPVQNEVIVHPVAKIDYDVTRRARRQFAGANFVELAMVTQNPADGCFYEIPLCVPECCIGEPQVTSYCGLLGRGVVKYCYECGLEVEVIFRLRGDVKVEYGT